MINEHELHTMEMWSEAEFDDPDVKVVRVPGGWHFRYFVCASAISNDERYDMESQYGNPILVQKSGT